MLLSKHVCNLAKHASLLTSRVKLLFVSFCVGAHSWSRRRVCGRLGAMKRYIRPFSSLSSPWSCSRLAQFIVWAQNREYFASAISKRASQSWSQAGIPFHWTLYHLLHFRPQILSRLALDVVKLLKTIPTKTPLRLGTRPLVPLTPQICPGTNGLWQTSQLHPFF